MLHTEAEPDCWLSSTRMSQCALSFCNQSISLIRRRYSRLQSFSTFEEEAKSLRCFKGVLLCFFTFSTLVSVQWCCMSIKHICKVTDPLQREIFSLTENTFQELQQADHSDYSASVECTAFQVRILAVYGGSESSRISSKIS